MSNLAAEKCPPCDEGGKALVGSELADLERQLGEKLENGGKPPLGEAIHV
jgi:hypothetical protein